MALAHASRLLGVNDAAIYKMSTDPVGSPPTYAAKVDIAGVKELQATLELDVKELRGDNTLLAVDTILRRITGSLSYAKQNFDVLAAASSMTAADSGTTPNQKTTMNLVQTDSPANFKLEAQDKQVDYIGGDVHVILWKCVPQSIPFGFAEEDYRLQALPFTAMPLIGTPATAPAQAWLQLVANETAAAIT